MLEITAVLAMVAWLVLLALPVRSWRNGEVLDQTTPDAPLLPLTVLVPARNEVDYIGDTVAALSRQAQDVEVIVIDDGSTDGTAAAAADAGARVIRSAEKPDGWSGKLWALEQGLSQVTRSRILLLDADITVDDGFLAAMQSAMTDKGVALLSIMARLRTASLWERLLIPAFVFFFKQMYPFRLANSRAPLVAAAAGGCIMIEARVLRDIGGFDAIKDAIIDDCTLARKVKNKGHRTWIGLSHRVTSRRAYDSLGAIWTMVDRTAFCQLKFSILLLALCTLVMMICFWAPVAALATPASVPFGLVGLGAMATSYLPTLHFYRQSPLWALAMPLIATLYLAMTWSSAAKHLFGSGVEWKGRQYR